ncbi:MAG TPA: ABC transporter substrate-binding protein [Xanthobacteraceae bacterium]|nr:ABC transporter substrate-binding protein [Xanthobacteraceae bacterium]
MPLARPSRRAVLTAGALLLVPSTSPRAAAQSTLARNTRVQIGVPTRAYWPTIVVEAALRNRLFEKEGIAAELTIYKGGAEELEGLAAAAADLVMITPLLVSIGRSKGAGAKMIGGGNQDYAGWHMMVNPGSKIARPEDLDGKNVAITSTGGGADLAALYLQQARKIKFVRVSVGGGGLVPSLTSGNVDAVVVPPPLSYNLLKSGEARSLVDFSKEIPLHQAAGWTTTEKNIKERPEVMQKALNAVYGGLAYLDANRDFAVNLIAEIDDIPADIAAVEYENGIRTLPLTAEVTADRIAAAFELNKLLGASGLIPPAEVFTDQFFAKMVPTKP